jgi:inosose dehydratase
MDHWGERIWHVHFKDFDPTRLQGNYFQSVANGVFCELGQGVVDFPGVLQRVRDGWIVVEQDVLPGMGSPMRSAQRNRSYLRSLGL